MKAIRFAGVAACLVGLFVAACGGSAGKHQATATATASFKPITENPAAQAPKLTCGTMLSNIGLTAKQAIAMLVQDQKAQNKALEENWVGVLSGSLTSEGQDLQEAVNGFSPYASLGLTTLETDITQFDTDATTFMSDQSGGLMPGWTAEAGQIESDIHALALDCGIKMHVPKGFTV